MNEGVDGGEGRRVGVTGGVGVREGMGGGSVEATETPSSNVCVVLLILSLLRPLQQLDW